MCTLLLKPLILFLTFFTAILKVPPYLFELPSPLSQGPQCSSFYQHTLVLPSLNFIHLELYGRTLSHLVSFGQYVFDTHICC